MWGGPRAGRSAAGGGASVRYGGPSISSKASTVGSSLCGSAGGAGGMAASPAGCAASRVWLSGTGVGPGWPPGSADRGVSAGTVARVASRSGSGPGFGAGRLWDGVFVGPTAGPAGGLWARWDAGSACAGASGWPPGADALGVAGAWGLGLSLGLWAWGRTVPRGRALVVSVGVAVRVCVGGPSVGECVGLFVGRIGVPWCERGSDWACVAAAWRAAGWRPRVARPVVFGVVEPHRLWGLGLGPCAGVRCQGVARVGCLLSPYSWSWARLVSRQMTPGAPGLSWLRAVVPGVVVPPVWMHVLVRGSLACRPPMVPERP